MSLLWYLWCWECSATSAVYCLLMPRPLADPILGLSGLSGLTDPPKSDLLGMQHTSDVWNQSAWVYFGWRVVASQRHQNTADSVMRNGSHPKPSESCGGLSFQHVHEQTGKQAPCHYLHQR